MVQIANIIVGNGDRAWLAAAVGDRNRLHKPMQRAKIILLFSGQRPVLEVARHLLPLSNQFQAPVGLPEERAAPLIEQDFFVRIKPRDMTWFRLDRGRDLAFYDQEGQCNGATPGRSSSLYRA